MIQVIGESGEVYSGVELIRGSGHGRSWVICPVQPDSGVYVILGAENQKEAMTHWVLSRFAQDPIFRWNEVHDGPLVAWEGPMDLDFEVRSIEQVRQMKILREKQQEPVW